MTPNRAKLHLVNTETGEIIENVSECSSCQYMQDEIDGLNREIRAWRLRYANLARDKEAEMVNHDLYPDIVKLFNLWRDECKHPRSELTSDRFQTILPLLKRYGYEMCARAIAGIAYDPFTKERKNGSMQRFDGWEILFKTAGHLERYANAAPKEWKLLE